MAVSAIPGLSTPPPNKVPKNRIVTPAKAGVQNRSQAMDSGLRRNDERGNSDTLLCGAVLSAAPPK
jgi:hypothetical protein